MGVLVTTTSKPQRKCSSFDVRPPSSVRHDRGEDEFGETVGR